jgi:serine/threonine-protein kinase TTK/MPS1
LMSERDSFMHPESCKDLRIPEELLGQIIANVAKRFGSKDKPHPTEEEIKGWAPSFYAKIREWAEEG